MNHQEIKDLLPLYALGGLENESTTAIESHLAEPCDTCVAELREWREVVGMIPLGLAPTGADAKVKERLMARVQQDLGARVIPFAARRKRAVWVTLPLAAAATGLLVIGGLRYQHAVRQVAEQTTRADSVATLLAHERERLASREREIQDLRARLAEQQAVVEEKVQVIAQLEETLAAQRQLVALRERELAQVQRVVTEERGTTTAYGQEIANLKEELARQQEAMASRERALQELRTRVEQQRALVAANEREIAQLRDALVRQQGVIEVLGAPGLHIGYLRRAKVGVDTRGHVLWNERKKTWLFYAFGLPQPPAGKEYQVWFMTDREGPVSAGLFTPDHTGTGRVIATPPPRLFGRITAAAVTLEPAGGLPKPSGEMYLRGSL